MVSEFYTVDQILTHEFGLTSFSAKNYFRRYIATALYLLSGFHSKYTNEKSIWSIQMQNLKHMEGRSEGCPGVHPLRQQEAEEMPGHMFSRHLK